jgi:hypothetical protein
MRLCCPFWPPKKPPQLSRPLCETRSPYFPQQEFSTDNQSFPESLSRHLMKDYWAQRPLMRLSRPRSLGRHGRPRLFQRPGSRSLTNPHAGRRPEIGGATARQVTARVGGQMRIFFFRGMQYDYFWRWLCSVESKRDVTRQVYSRVAHADGKPVR